MPGSRARRAAYYALPMLFCLAVHWMAIETWFSADDFAWLGLPLEIQHSFRDWLDVLFRPRAQGTIRTLSERVYFLVFTYIFGLNALPFRLWVFATQFANIALLIWITCRITGSKLAGFAAPILWSANAALAVSLDWSSAYNEICCAFFLLLSFFFLLRFIDTGQRKFWILQWVAFLLGFGALELIVMYPPVAALYTFLNARKYFASTLWLFVPSALFTVLHFTIVPKSNDPTYAMHFNLGIFSTLWKYWVFAVAASRPDLVDWRPLWLGVALAAIISCATLFLLVRHTRLTLFPLAWFLLLLLPLLPLSRHFTEYYATLPSIGLAILGAWALSRYRRTASVLVMLYLIVSVADIYAADKYFYERARRMKKLVLALEANQNLYQGKQVILGGVDSDLFWSGFYDDPFRLLGITQIYLLPGSEKSIEVHPEWGAIDRFIITPDAAMAALKTNKAEVFSVLPDGIKDITGSYRKVALSRYLATHREMVDAGDPAYQGMLGTGWYNAEDGFRWIGKSASLQLGGPKSAGQTLAITGYCPAPVVAGGPVELTVQVDRQKVGSIKLKQPDQHFELSLPLPAEAAGKYAIEVSVEVSRTTHIGSDVRPLGLIFGTFRIK